MNKRELIFEEEDVDEQDSFEFTIKESPPTEYIDFFEAWECLKEMQRALIYNA